MQKSAPELIDLRDETKSTLDMYGVGRKDLPNAGRGGGKNVFSNFSTNCLLARRMVERGVRFVNIYHASWDHHSNLEKELRYNATMADQPVAALIKDLKQRGLLDDTLVVWGSEFGRTPLGENRGGRSANTGRDHHPFSFSIFMAGGGIRGGQVIGEQMTSAGTRSRSGCTSTISMQPSCIFSGSTMSGSPIVSRDAISA